MQGAVADFVVGEVMRSWDGGLSLRVRLQTGVQCYKYVCIVAVGRRDGSRRARLLRWKDLWVVEVVARRCGVVGLLYCVCVW